MGHAVHIYTYAQTLALFLLHHWFQVANIFVFPDRVASEMREVAG